MTIKSDSAAEIVVRCISASLTFWCCAFGHAVAGPPEHPPVSRVVKLKHLAVILPELQIVRESWGDKNGPAELWTPTVQQVAVAEKAILRRLEEEAKAGAKVDAKGKYIIQYYGLVLKPKRQKVIVCQMWRTEALAKDPGMQFDELLVTLFTQSYSATIEPSDTEPAEFLEVLYDPASGNLSGDLGEGSRTREKGKRG